MKMKIIAALLVLCCFALPSSAFAADTSSTSQLSRNNIVVASGASEFTLDILVNSSTKFSSAEFGMKLNGNIAIKKVTYPSSVGGSSVGPLEKNGTYYFGFFDSANNYVNSMTVCTVTFSYTGSEAASVTLQETNITRITDTGGATKETLSPGLTTQITRAASTTDPTNPTNPTDPTNPTNPTDPTTPADGEGTSNGRFVVRVDSLQALSLLEQAQTDSSGYRTIDLNVKTETEGKKEIAVEWPVSLFQTTEQRKLVVETALGTFVIPANAIPDSQLGTNSMITLVIKQVSSDELPASAKSAIGNRTVLDLHFELNGNAITWNNGTAPILVSVPYTPSASEASNTDQIIVDYIDGQGVLHTVPNSRYNASEGVVTFQTNHFSMFGIATATKSFTDTKTSWAKKEIEALAARGIITGKTADSFDPNANITRADFTKLLVGVIGKNASPLGAGFSDVKPEQYFYDAIMNAQALGLANGSSDNKFNPKNLITRQDMAVLLDRALIIAGKPVTDLASLSSFKDAGQISAYAKDSLAKLVGAGIMNGSDGKLRPKDSLTRAEAAKVLYKLFEITL